MGSVYVGTMQILSPSSSSIHAPCYHVREITMWCVDVWTPDFTLHEMGGLYTRDVSTLHSFKLEFFQRNFLIGSINVKPGFLWFTYVNRTGLVMSFVIGRHAIAIKIRWVVNIKIIRQLTVLILCQRPHVRGDQLTLKTSLLCQHCNLSFYIQRTSILEHCYHMFDCTLDKQHSIIFLVRRLHNNASHLHKSINKLYGQFGINICWSLFVVSFCYFPKRIRQEYMHCDLRMVHVEYSRYSICR